MVITLLLTSPLGLGFGMIAGDILRASSTIRNFMPAKLFVFWIFFYSGGFLQWFVLLPLSVKLAKKLWAKHSANTNHATD